MIWKTLPRFDPVCGLAGHRCGSGPDMVLIHGVGLRSEAWGAMIPPLSDRFTLHLIDLPGHGQSAPAKGDALQDFVAPVRAYLQQIGGACVVGHSMGAMIALAVAAQAPALVHGVAALNAIYRRSQSAATAVQARAKVLATSGASDPAPTLARWFTDLQSPAALACGAWLQQADPADYARAYRVFAHHDGPADTDLAHLKMPALFITGAQEPNSTPQMSRAMAALAPQGHAYVIENAAHMAPMTHADEISAALGRHFPPTGADADAD